jgi:hypothetical protein
VPTLKSIAPAFTMPAPSFTTRYALGILAASLALQSGCGTPRPIILRPIYSSDITPITPGQRLTAPTNRPQYYLISDEYLTEILDVKLFSTTP